MTFLVLGLVLFLGVHSVSILADGWRTRSIAAHGAMVWRVGYSLLSTLGLGLIVWGYGQARLDPVVVYTPPAAMRHLTMLLMLPVFPLLLAAYLPGRLQRAARHPMLAAIKLWALAHLLSNGMAHELLLFGAFLAWAVADRLSLKHRPPRAVPGAPARPANDAIAIGGGLALYLATLFWAHRWVIGVPLIGA